MLILLALILFLGAIPAHASAGVDHAFGKIDLMFEQNEGQVDRKVRFLSRGAGYNLFLTNDETVMQFTSAPKAGALRMRLIGRNRRANVEGLEVTAGSTNYLRADQHFRKTDIRSYKKVRYSGVYPGIDLEYHGNGRLLEYDFIVNPGSNPSQIRLSFSGTHGRSVDSTGDLILKTAAGHIVQKKPRVYQRIDGKERIVEASYLLSGNDVKFKVGDYDKTQPLIIDPVLVYSTFVGGSGSELAYGIAVDVRGSVYITGVTTSADFPVASAAQSTIKGGSTDAFVVKLDSNGGIAYSTFLGGSGTDEAHGIAVDAGGNAYITGYTTSADFPIVNGFQRTRPGLQDAYFVKLNSVGNSILYSTYLGGSADDRGFGIALDAANNIYITGTTASTNFPTANPIQRSNAGGFVDAFVTKLSPAGNLVYSTYIGGNGNDNPLGIAVDGNGAAYVTGWTSSIKDFPLVNAYQSKFGGLDSPVGTDDAFVFKVNSAGTALDYSTYIGGIGSDEATRIAVDSTGSAYITGFTSSLNFPTVKPYQATLNGGTSQDAFVTKLAPDGKSLIFSTYFGGFQAESGTGIAVDSSGSVYISGFTNSFDLPTANEIQGFIAGDLDAFLAKFDPSGGVLVFSSFLGGSGADAAINLAIDAARNVYVTGRTTSGDFKIVNAAQPAFAGTQDAFIAKINVEDIVASSQFQVAPQGASSVITKGTRTDAVFGYATAEPVVPGTQLTGLAIIDRRQNGAIVSEVGIPAPAYSTLGRLFVDVSSSTRSVLSIANPNDDDASVDIIYTDDTGNTSKFVTVTVAAHQHFSRFVTDDPLSLQAPGTLNFTSSIPVAATSFFTTTNESSELLISATPIVNPVENAQAVGNRTITLPELADGGGWRSDVVLVNTTEDRMNGEVRFLTQGSGTNPGTPLEVGIGDGTSTANVVEFDIPARSFQAVSTAGSSTSPETPFALTRGTSIRTPGAGPFQISGWASADSNSAATRLNGLEILEYRQLGITQSQTGLIAPALRQNGRVFVELTDKIRSFIAFANPNDEDVSVDISLTDDAGTSTDPVTITVPAQGQYSQFVSDAPISVATGTTRTLSFSASMPVFVNALRFFSNERNDSLLSSIPIADTAAIVSAPVVIPEFADGAGWTSQIILVNAGEDEMHGEIRFLSQGSLADAPQGIEVGTGAGTASVFEYSIPAHSSYRLQTNGLMDNMSVGSVRISPFAGSNTPAAYSILAVQIGGNTIFETSIPGQAGAKSFTLYAEAIGDFGAGTHRSSRTTIAIANPSSATAAVQLELTSFDGTRVGISSPVQIAANAQIAWFIEQFPGLEGLKVPLQGTARLTVVSGNGVSVAGFRALINERGDYLFTTTGPLNENAGKPGRLIFPYVTDSTGYTTQFILVNLASSQATSGTLHYLAPDGSPLQLDTLKLGSVQIVPFAGFNTPHAHLILNHRDGGVLTFQTSIEGELPAKTFRMYAESIGDFDAGTAGSTRSGISLANPSSTVATVVLEMRGLNGALLRTSGPINVPPNGQVSMFLNSAPGFETLLVPFEGILRVTATSAQGITAAGFRAMYNERGNVLFTTTGPLVENAGSPTELVFPHIAEGGGYTTQFIVIGGATGQSNSGVLRFFNEQGNPLNLTLSER